MHPLKTILFSLSQPLEKFCGSAHENTLSSNNGLNDEWIMMSTSFLAANKDQEFDQLKLALAWNRIDIAKSEIFTEDKIWPVLTLLIIASIIYVPIKKKSNKIKLSNWFFTGLQLYDDLFFVFFYCTRSMLKEFKVIFNVWRHIHVYNFY